MRTFVASAKSADSRWHVIDANGQVLGRVATLTARLLQGKHKADLHPVHRYRAITSSSSTRRRSS